MRTASTRPAPQATAAQPAATSERASSAGSHPSQSTQARPGGTSPRKRVLAGLGLAVALVALAFQVAPVAGAEGGSFNDRGVTGVVAAEGPALAAGGEPWKAVGYNDYRLTSAPGGSVCDGGYGPVDDDEMDARMDRAAESGATTIRTWFFQAAWDPDGDGSGEWKAFDRVITAAAERGMRVIPVLANHWGDCEAGGMSKTIDFYAGGYRSPYAGDALSYLEYAERVAGRYAGSPAIAFWQLINEPEAGSAEGCDEAAAAEAISGFAAEAAATIRSVDPDHLVSLGTIGGGQCGTAGDNFMKAHEAVDVCEIHVYDHEGANTSPTTALPGDAHNGVAARIAACEAAGKPVVAGEIGFAADLDSSGNQTGTVTDETLATRAKFMTSRVNAMNELGLDGFLVWQLDSRDPLEDDADTYAIGPCDPVESVVAAAAGAQAPACG